MLFHIHIPTYTRRYVYTCLCACEHIPELSNRSLDAVRDSSKEFLLFRVLLHIHVYRLFSPSVWAIFLQLACVRSRDREKKERKGKGKTYFGMKNRAAGVIRSRTCVTQRFLRIANDNEECPPLPPCKLTFANDNGRNCLGKKKTKKKKHLSDFLDKEP